MGDLDRRSRKLVHGWSSGGLVVGLLPDSSHREWSGKAALELATAAAQDRLAALVLDLAPDATDLASRFGADPEPGFAQVMTGEVELSEIQHWDAARGAYYLPGGVRVLSDKVARSRSVEALADRVRGQEGILFVLLDRHAAEAAAESGWLDGVVRLGQADLGGPKMFGEVTALGHLERRETAATTKPWEREESGSAASGVSAASGAPEPSVEDGGEPADDAVPDDPGGADLTVEPEEPVPAGTDDDGAPAPRKSGSEQPPEPGRSLDPAASAEPDVAEGPGEPEITAEPADAGAPEADAEPEVTEPRTPLEVSEEAWEPDVAARTDVLDRPATEPDAAEAEGDRTDDPSVIDITDAGAEEAGEESGDEEPAAAPEPPVLQVSEALWEPREVEEPGVSDEPEIVADGDELEAADEVEAEDEEPAGPEVAREETPPEEVLGDEAELQPAEEPGEAEVAETADEPAAAETGDEDEVEADDAEPAAPEVAEEERPGEEVSGPEIGAEPEITETPAEEADSDRQAADVEVEDADETAEPEIEPDRADGGEEPEVAEGPAELDVAEQPAEPEVADGSEITESPEETAEEEIDRPVGLERFAETPDEAEAPETDAEDGDAEPAEPSEPVSEPAPEPRADEKSEEDREAGADEEIGEDRESGQPVHAEVITSGLDVWPEEADEPVASGETADPEAADACSGTEDAAAGVISAAPWASPGENGESRQDEEPERADFISPAMWFSDTAGTQETESPEAESGSADVISRGRWGRSGPAEPSAEPSTPTEAGGSAADGESAEGTAGEPVEPDDEDGQESSEPQRADFILDGLELPPEWSEEWEEEERAAAESRDEEAAAEDSEQEDGPEAESEEEAEEETAGQADFVTQGMGLPDDDVEDDPWPDSGASRDWKRSGGGAGGGTWGSGGGTGGSGRERNPYGGSGGRAAAAAGAGDRENSSGLALERRGAGQGGLWKRARKAAVVILAVGAVGALGSAVLDGSAVSALRDVVATAGGGSGAGSSSGADGSGSVAAAGAGGPGAAAAVADSTSPPSTSGTQDDPDPGTSSTAGAPPEEAAPRPASDAPGFRAVADSLSASIDDYDEQIDLYREGSVGCPLLMSTREEAGRLFVRLSAFRLSDAARPDSVFRRAYRRFSEEMETVEGTYRQTECPRPATAPRESAAAELPQQGPAPVDSVGPGSDGAAVDSPAADSAVSDSAAAESTGADGASGDTSVTAEEELPAGEAADTTPSPTETGTDSTSAADSTDSTSAGQPADSTTGGA